MGNVQMEARQIRYGSTNVEEALNNGGGSAELEGRVEALETTVSELDPNNYSSTEVKVGKFLGSDLYRKVIDTGALPNNTTKRVSSGLTNETVRFMYGAATHTTSGDVIPLPRMTATQITSQCTLRFYTETMEIGMSTGSDLSDFGSSYVVLEYTKNSANNANR